MARVLRTPQARIDPKGIWRHIAVDNPVAATAFLRRIEQTCQTLSDYPHRGVDRPELSDIQSLPVGRYVVFYRVVEGGIEVVRVLHGAMDVPAHFQGH